ncbi:transcription factor kayak-like [Diaphorina citri]|uniref:Transcription factor kayak-like n=1 Tax=Diaphorina citri TaxID=121845 RepID=A0A3Q0JA91_DIACI|nr:transcription factor kayak-like [Diaphorina citri]
MFVISLEEEKRREVRRERNKQAAARCRKRRMDHTNELLMISLEEEKRREVRRERNKQAAARCRKRRMDHTNELLMETEGLAQKKVLLSEEVAQLRAEVQQLELLLESHQMSCRMSRVSPDTGVDENAPNPSFLEQEKVTVGGVTISIKSEPGTQVHPECAPVNNTNNKRVALGNNNRPRPNSLPVSSSPYLNHASSVSKHQSESRTGGPAPAPLISDIAGIPISTPSTGIVFNFESLMEGGSGMTPLANPIVPSCSSQQRGDCATSPDAVNSKRMLSL